MPHGLKFSPIGLLAILLAVVLSISVSASSQASDKWSEAGVAEFKIPSDWKLNDRSTEQIYQLNIVPDEGKALIIVSVYRKKISYETEFYDLKNQISKPRQGKIAQRFSGFTEKANCIELGSRTMPGDELSGSYDNVPTTSGSYSFVVNGRFVHLLYLREDKTAGHTDQGWKTVLQSFSVSGDAKKDLNMFDGESGESLNGTAIRLPRPLHPLDRSEYDLPTTVVVRIWIDTNGDVVKAKAISGRRNFHSVSEAAAKKAKFSPKTVCGKLVEFSGTVTYRFVAY